MNPSQAAQKKQTRQRFIRSARISGGVAAVAALIAVVLLFGNNLAIDTGLLVILALLAVITVVIGVLGVIVCLIGAAISGRSN